MGGCGEATRDGTAQGGELLGAEQLRGHLTLKEAHLLLPLLITVSQLLYGCQTDTFPGWHRGPGCQVVKRGLNWKSAFVRLLIHSFNKRFCVG